MHFSLRNEQTLGRKIHVVITGTLLISDLPLTRQLTGIHRYGHCY
jgi:hypothetical protein